MSDNNLTKEPNSKSLKNIPSILILLVIAGFIFFLFIFPLLKGTISILDRSYISVTGKTSTAIVESYESIPHTQKNGNIIYTYIPRLKINVDGYNILSTSNFNEISEELLPIGSEVSIKYDINNPTKAIITTLNFVSYSLSSYFFYALFIGFFIISMIVNKKFKKYENTTRTKGLGILCSILSLFLLGIFIFLIWQGFTGQLSSLSTLSSSIILIIFAVVDIKLLTSLLKLYIKNNALKYIV
ncbi:MAG: hypothetical protein ACRCTZ_22180 [Sarcina sp.]